MINIGRSQGLGNNPSIAVKLEGVRDITTNQVIFDNLATLQALITEKTTAKIKEMLELGRQYFVLEPEILEKFKNKIITLNFSIKNSVTNEALLVQRVVSVLSDQRVEVSDHVLRVSRTNPTKINNVRVLSCGSTTAVLPKCKALVFVESTATDVLGNDEIELTDCLIDPSKVKVQNIYEIWVEVHDSGTTKTINVVFEIEEVR